MQDVNVLNDLR
jgi:hypothetical protein